MSEVFLVCHVLPAPLENLKTGQPSPYRVLEYSSIPRTNTISICFAMSLVIFCRPKNGARCSFTGILPGKALIAPGVPMATHHLSTSIPGPSGQPTGYPIISLNVPTIGIWSDIRYTHRWDIAKVQTGRNSCGSTNLWS